MNIQNDIDARELKLLIENEIDLIKPYVFDCNKKQLK